MATRCAAGDELTASRDVSREMLEAAGIGEIEGVGISLRIERGKGKRMAVCERGSTERERPLGQLNKEVYRVSGWSDVGNCKFACIGDVWMKSRPVGITGDNPSFFVEVCGACVIHKKLLHKEAT